LTVYFLHSSARNTRPASLAWKERGRTKNPIGSTKHPRQGEGRKEKKKKQRKKTTRLGPVTPGKTRGTGASLETTSKEGAGANTYLRTPKKTRPSSPQKKGKITGTKGQSPGEKSFTGREKK